MRTRTAMLLTLALGAACAPMESDHVSQAVGDDDYDDYEPNDCPDPEPFVPKDNGLWDYHQPGMEGQLQWALPKVLSIPFCGALGAGTMNPFTPTDIKFSYRQESDVDGGLFPDCTAFREESHLMEGEVEICGLRGTGRMTEDIRTDATGCKTCEGNEEVCSIANRAESAESVLETTTTKGGFIGASKIWNLVQAPSFLKAWGDFKITGQLIGRLGAGGSTTVKAGTICDGSRIPTTRSGDTYLEATVGGRLEVSGKATIRDVGFELTGRITPTGTLRRTWKTGGTCDQYTIDTAQLSVQGLLFAGVVGGDLPGARRPVAELTCSISISRNSCTGAVNDTSTGCNWKRAPDQDAIDQMICDGAGYECGTLQTRESGEIDCGGCGTGGSCVGNSSGGTQCVASDPPDGDGGSFQCGMLADAICSDTEPYDYDACWDDVYEDCMNNEL